MKRVYSSARCRLSSRVTGCAGLKKFQPRPVDDLNRDLSKRYGLPVDLGAKTGSLAAIAQALSRGDIIHAQVATLHLQIPDPPPLAKGPQSATRSYCSWRKQLRRQRPAQGGLGPSETSALAGRKSGWDRWRARARQ